MNSAFSVGIFTNLSLLLNVNNHRYSRDALRCERRHKDLIEGHSNSGPPEEVEVT